MPQWPGVCPANGTIRMSGATDQIAHAAKAKPALSVESIGLPGNRTIPLHRQVPPAIECAITLPRSSEFGVEHMHGGPGKSSIPPAWSKSRWVIMMWRTSSAAKPRASI